MPEENGTRIPPSGGSPGGVHPTVIRCGMPAEVPKERKPTVIAPPVSQLNSQSPAAAVVPPIRPTAIAGTVRMGAHVSVEDLTRHFPGTPVEVLKSARYVLEGVVLDLLTDSQCVMWGGEIQKRFGELTERSLELTGSKVVQDSERHLARLYAILEELDEALRHKSSQGLLFWRKEETVWEKFQAAGNELNQLRTLLGQALPAIVDVESSLASLSSEFEKLCNDLDAESLAGRYIAEELLHGKDRTKQSLLDRSISLTETVAHIRQGILLRGQTADILGQFVSRVQDGVLHTLPAWIEIVTLAYQHSSHTETELYTLRQGLEDIINRLK